MHEMPYTQALLELALEKAAGRRIRTIYLRVGWMSAIVPAAVEGFFDHLSQGTPAEGAALDFTFAPIVLRCQTCRQPLELPYDPDGDPRRAMARAFQSGCPCGAGKLTLEGGLSVDVTAIDVV